MIPTLLLLLFQPPFSLCLLLFNSFLNMIMSFYKKSFPSFLGSDPTTTTTAAPTTSTPFCKSSHHANNHHDHLSNGLGLINQASGNDIQCPPQAFESASVKSVSSPLLLPQPMIHPKRDPGGIGFIDDIGGGVDGLMSCTESLGFESSEERLVNDDDHMVTDCNSNDSGMISLNHDSDNYDIDHDQLRYWRIKRSRRWLSGGYDGGDKVKKFPPPLSSLNQNGQPSFFLRPVRKEGRLELMEVRIDRPPKILQASRQDGRLRLHLIREDDDNTNHEDNVQDLSIEEEEKEEVAAVEKEELEIEEEGEGEVVDQNVDYFDDENRNKDSRGEWRFNPAGGDQALWRCNDRLAVIGHHHHQHQHRNPPHHFHVWTPNCLTIR